MPRPAPSLFACLRRHRGLWLLAVAVLTIKLVAGTICLGDAPDMRLAAAVASATLPVISPLVADAGADASGDCLLGEPGGCHCSCAHSMVLPAAALAPVATMAARFASPAIPRGVVPAMTGSLLRPPIA